MIRRWLLVMTALAVAGCSYSASQTRIPDDRPAIGVSNAPDDASLLVDGRLFGLVSQYFGDQKVLRLEPGTHIVAITLNGRTLLSEKVFLGGGEIRMLTVPGGAQ